MGKTMTAIFDGTVLRPESPVDLEPDTRYLVTVEALRAKADTHSSGLWVDFRLDATTGIRDH